jgi:hypothetical protein
VKSYSPNNPITGNPAIIIERYVKDEDNPDADNLANNNENNENNNPGDNNNPDASSNFNPNDPDESVDLTPKTEIKKENFTELLKISYIVRNIDFDTNVFPQGAFRLIPIHELRRNESFTGLKPEELRDLSKFHHFRPIRLPKNKELIESDEAIFRFDFLDSIEDDKVKSSWSIQVDSTKTMVIIYLNIF